MKTLLSACLSIICAFSSFSQEGDKEIVATRIKSIDTYNSDEFVVSVSDITLFNDHIVMLDEKLSRVIVSDKELSALKTFGVRGDGPQELKKPYMLIKDDVEGVLYVYDNERFRLWPVDIDKRVLGKGISFELMLFNQTVAVENSMLYFTSLSSPKVDVVKYSLKDKKQLEGIALHENSVESFMGRYILSTSNRFVVVSPYDGLVIDTYDENWSRMNSIDLGKHPLIAKGLNSNRSSRVSSRSIGGGGSVKLRPAGKITIRGVRLYGNDLYFLAYSRDKDLKSRANVILKYTYENEQWQSSGRIMLPQEGSYKTFQVLIETNQLVAFDSVNGTIDLFDLSN